MRRNRNVIVPCIENDSLQYRLRSHVTYFSLRYPIIVNQSNALGLKTAKPRERIKIGVTKAWVGWKASEAPSSQGTMLRYRLHRRSTFRCALRGSGLIVTAFRLSSPLFAPPPTLVPHSHLQDAVPQRGRQSSTRWRALITVASQPWKRLVSSHAGSCRAHIRRSPNTPYSPSFRCYEAAFTSSSCSYAQLDYEDPFKHRFSSVDCSCRSIVRQRSLRKLSNPHVAHGNSYRRRYPQMWIKWLCKTISSLPSRVVEQ